MGDRLTRRVALLSACLLAAVAPTVAAQTGDVPADSAAAYARAEELYARADTLSERSDTASVARAIALWLEAASIYESLGRTGDLAPTLVRIGYAHVKLEDLSGAIAYFRRGLGIAVRRQSTQALAWTHRPMAVTFERLGQSDSALVHYHAALAAQRELGWTQEAGVTLHDIATVHKAGARPDSAAAYYHRSLADRRAAGDRRGEAITLNDIGLLHSRPDSAIAYLRAALAIEREIGYAEGANTTMRNMAPIATRVFLRGDTLADAGQTDSALVFFRLTLDVARDLRDRKTEMSLLSKIGLTLDDARWEEAVDALRQSLAIKEELRDSVNRSTILGFVGHAYQTHGRRDSAAVYLFRAHEAAMRENPDNVATILATLSRVWNDSATILDDAGRPDSAFAYYHRALVLARESGDRDVESGVLTNTAALLSRMGMADSAIAVQRQALGLRPKEADLSFDATLLHSLGVLFQRRGDLDSAIVYFDRALDAWRAVGDSLGEGRMLQAVAGLWGSMNTPDSAIAYYRRALTIYRQLESRDHANAVLQEIATMNAALQRVDSALAYYAQALALVRDAGDRNAEAAALHGIGMMYWGLGRLDSAAASFGGAAQLFASTRRSAGNDLLRVSYAETVADSYDAWTRAWLDMADSATTQDGRRRAQLAALAASDRWRAQALLDLMHGTRDPASRVDIAAEGDSLVRALTVNGATLIAYHLTPYEVIAWIATDTSLAVARSPVDPDSLARWIGAFRAHVAAGGGSAARTAVARAGSARGFDAESGADSTVLPRLAAALLPPAVARAVRAARHVVIVPHGAIATVPFAALPLDSTGDVLGARVSLGYGPSLAALADIQTRRRGAGPRIALVVGNPTMPTVSEVAGAMLLPALPGADAEGQWVATTLGARILRGDSASESRVRLLLPRADVVHLATHGVAYSSEADARRSFVALAPDSAHDGLLTAGEIVDDPALRLTADLVVLSACQTALGDVKQSEGTVGLQRALLAKGARAVLVSLWSVDDDATAALMRAFYRHWRSRERPSKSEALRRAQQDLRTNAARPDWRHPRYWAAFQLVGAD